MARRRISIVDVLLVSRWWISVVAAAFFYALLAFAAPAYLERHPFAAGILIVVKSFAPFAAGLCLLIGFLSFLRSHLIKRRFNSLESVEHVRQLSWRQFEAIVGEAFRRGGYSVEENAIDGPDGGIDLVLEKDGAEYYVQCKRWKQTKVGVKEIRELYGVIAAGGVAGGFFVTSGEYTEEARDFARKCAIELIDGAALTEMVTKVREQEPFTDPKK